MYIFKRSGEKVPFDESKIVVAIKKAMNSSTGVYEEGLAEKIADEIKREAVVAERPLSIYDIEDKVYYKLIENKNPATARSYENYKAVQAFKRKINTTDESIIGLLDRKNSDLMKENSNKNAHIASTQRDLIAGEVSKDIARRLMIDDDLLQAHDEGSIHLHDMDYIIQPMFNCCLVNMKDMLDNGTVVNGKLIESPRSFQVACNVMTQIIAQIASNQYGGQSIDIKCLAKYLRRSYEKNLKLAKEMFDDEAKQDELARKLTQRDLESGIQTIQYQINTLMTSNGQAPFVTLFMHMEDDFEYADELAMIIEEILKQRIQGIKNECGVYVTPAFPKLVYVLDENNVHKDSKYYYLTQTAIKCTAKRMYPDYISAKKMRENYEGNVFAPMGCRAFLSPWKDKDGNYKFDGRFNMGVVSLNLPQIAIVSGGDEEKFFEILDKRLDLCRKACLLRYDILKNVTSDSSPIHWRHGAIARLAEHEPIRPLLEGGYATVTLGYIGLYEATYLVRHTPHTDEHATDFALKVMRKMNENYKLGRRKMALAMRFTALLLKVFAIDLLRRTLKDLARSKTLLTRVTTQTLSTLMLESIYLYLTSSNLKLNSKYFQRAAASVTLKYLTWVIT